jgi:hypothetical protein
MYKAILEADEVEPAGGPMRDENDNREELEYKEDCWKCVAGYEVFHLDEYLFELADSD